MSSSVLSPRNYFVIFILSNDMPYQNICKWRSAFEIRVSWRLHRTEDTFAGGGGIHLHLSSFPDDVMCYAQRSSAWNFSFS